jgi:hypothetical protein
MPSLIAQEPLIVHHHDLEHRPGGMLGRDLADFGVDDEASLQPGKIFDRRGAYEGRMSTTLRVELPLEQERHRHEQVGNEAGE